METITSSVNLSPEEKEKVDEQYRRKEYLSTCKIALKHSADARRRYDYEWMVRDLFRRGYQFSRYQPTTQTVILASRQTARIPVNIVAAYMRSIRNQVTSFRPKFEVLPRYTTKESEVVARYSGKLLDYYFDKLNFKKKIKETVTQGLMYSVGGPWQIVYDEDKKEVAVWLLDPFDFFFDMLGEELEDCEHVIKAVRRPLDEVRFNPQFDKEARKEVTGSEARLAVSEYKQFMLQALKYVTQYSREESPTVILFEGDFKVRDKDTGKVHIRKVIWTDQNTIPLYYEDLKTDKYDYVLYQADLNPKDILGESWMKHVMPINRVINSLESSVFDYNYRVAKGRIVVDKDSGVRSIHNVHGEIISKNRGAEVRALDMPSLPVATSAQIERMWRYGEDIAGVHDPTLGRVTPGSRSGVLLAEAKQSDACVDVETEALTPQGWKKYNELKEGEDIYLLDPTTKKSRWGKLNWIYWSDKVESEMYKADTKTISFLVTPDHPWMTINARDNWKKEETQNLKNDQRIPTAIVSSDIPVKEKYSDDFVELVGWVITEGTYSITKTLIDRGSFDIRIYQSEKNIKEIEQIQSLFLRLGITRKPYISPARGNGTKEWQFMFAKENAVKIRELFPTKSLTMDFVSRLTESQLHLLINTMILGDGCEVQGRTRKRKCFINTNKETIDSFQFACTLLGIPTSIGIKRKQKDIHSTCYVVYLKETPYVTTGHLIDGSMKKVKFTGRIWCPNTETGYWLARKNGCIFYTSNTNQDDLVDNLEDFLTDVGMKILEKIAGNYSKLKVIKDLGYKEEQAKYFAVIGENAKIKGKTDENHKNQVKIGPDWLDLAVIGSDNNIRVTIGSWLGYTKEMMQEKTIKLLQLGAIDQKTFLSLWEFGNIDKIVQQSRIESILRAHIDKPKLAGEPQEVDPYVENDMMVLEGKDVPVDQHDDHWIHYAVHQEAVGQGRDDLIGKHIGIHQMYMGQAPEEMPTTTAEPVTGNPNIQTPDMTRNAEVGAQVSPAQTMEQNAGIQGSLNRLMSNEMLPAQ